MSKISTLVDDFSSGTLDTGLWTPDGSAAVSGGALVIGLTYPTSEVRSAALYDATDSSVYAKMSVSATATADDWPQVYFSIVSYAATGGELWWVYFADDTGATLRWSAYAPGEVNSSAVVSYDPVAHAWLRIAMAGSTITFQTSPDGTAWTTLGTATTTNPDTFSSAKLNMYPRWSSYGGSTPPAGTATFDFINATPPPSGPLLSSSGQMSAIPLSVLAGGKVSWTAWQGRGGDLIAPPPTDFPAPPAPSLPTTWAPFPPPGGG